MISIMFISSIVFVVLMIADVFCWSMSKGENKQTSIDIMLSISLAYLIVYVIFMTVCSCCLYFNL